MKNKIQLIEPGVGLGSLKFGMLQSDVKNIIGLPNEIEIYCYTQESNDRTEHWHYINLELSLYFGGEDDWRLNSISIYSKYYSLMGTMEIGQKKADVKNRLKRNGITNYIWEDWSSVESPDHKLIEIDDLSLNLWFDHEILSEIQWSPKFEDEEIVIWPYITDLKLGKASLGFKRYQTDELFKQLDMHIQESLDRIFREREEHEDLINAFPLHTERENLTTENRSIFYYLNIESKVEGAVEAKARLIHNTEGDIGWMSLYWDNELELLDDFLVLDDY